jgi:hypothetical protein
MSGKKRRKASNSFRQAVQNTHELGEDAYCSGLRALTDSDSRRIVSGKVPILGSVNLDAALRLHYPNDARWDYGIGIQKGKPWTLWVEVHPADTSNVDEVLKKLTWLKDWLAHSAQPLHNLTPQQSAYHWLATDGVHINPNSPQARRLAAAGLTMPRRVLILDELSL